MYTGAHVNSVCVCLSKYAASIQSALKINRRVNKQDGERESRRECMCLLGERGEEGVVG